MNLFIHSRNFSLFKSWCIDLALSIAVIDRCVSFSFTFILSQQPSLCDHRVKMWVDLKEDGPYYCHSKLNAWCTQLLKWGNPFNYQAPHNDSPNHTTFTVSAKIMQFCLWKLLRSSSFVDVCFFFCFLFLSIADYFQFLVFILIWLVFPFRIE